MNLLPSPHHLGQRLDLLLAERILEGGLRGAQLFQMRQRRDEHWILGLLGLRGLHVTLDDITTCLERRPGRFLPRQPEARLIQGVRKAIDDIDEAVDVGQALDADRVREIHIALTEKLEGQEPGTLRCSSPWDSVTGLVHPGADLVPVLMKRFSHDFDLVLGDEPFEELHPVDQGARIFGRLVLIAPFRDFNVLVASLAASQFLLARGYPPFMPKSCDRENVDLDLGGSDVELARRFASIVFRGFVAMRAG
mgnify:CR=1 FL=1